jgi:hypothetical protein
MSSLTRFNFLTASAYARCPSTTIGGRQRLRWSNVVLWWYHARLLWGHHWFPPCWILPTWRIRVAHAPNLPARARSSFSCSAKHNKQSIQMATTHNRDSLKAPQHKEMKFLLLLLLLLLLLRNLLHSRNKNKDTKTHTRGVSVHSELWISSPSCYCAFQAWNLQCAQWD